MTWEQRFGALIELGGAEWDAAHKRLEQKWLGAYTAAFVEIAVSRGWRREDAETWPVGIGDEAFKPIATTGTRGGRLRKTLSLAKNHPDCPIRARPIKTSTPRQTAAFRRAKPCLCCRL